MSNNGASFGFGGSNGSEIDHFECKLSGPPQAHDWTSCTSPQPYADLVGGTYPFEVRAYDAALNVDAPLASRTWTVDSRWHSSVAAGGDHNCGTRIDGSLWCWKRNHYSQLGDGTAWKTKLTPVVDP